MTNSDMSILRGGPNTNDNKTEAEVAELMLAASNKYRHLKAHDSMSPEEI